MLDDKFRDMKWKQAIKIESKDYGIQEINLAMFGVVNPTGYQELGRNTIEIYMKGKTPEKSDGRVIPIEIKRAKTMTINYNGQRNITFH